MILLNKGRPQHLGLPRVKLLINHSDGQCDKSAVQCETRAEHAHLDDLANHSVWLPSSPCFIFADKFSARPFHSPQEMTVYYNVFDFPCSIVHSSLCFPFFNIDVRSIQLF